MSLHLVTLVDQAQKTPDKSEGKGDGAAAAQPALPEGWRRQAGDLCYIALRGSIFLASSYLIALGLPLVFFLALSAGDAALFFAHLANLGDRFLDAGPARQMSFLHEFKLVLIAASTLIVAWRLPRFMQDLDRELSGEVL